MREVWHGVEVDDPYRWLEAGDRPEVQDWTRAQNEHARAWLAACPARGELRERLARLVALGSQGTPAPRGGRLFFERRDGSRQQPALYVREGLHGSERELIDAARLSTDGASALDWYFPSPDGRRLAYGVSQAGSERSVLRVLDVDSGRPLDDEIPFTRACSLAWEPDGSGFLYTRYPAPGSVPSGEESYHRRVYAHTLGDDWRADTLLFGAGRAPTDWPEVLLSPDGRYVVVTVQRGWSACDLYLLDRRKTDGFVPLAEGLDALFGVSAGEDVLYVVTNLAAPRGRLLAIDLARPAREAWRALRPEGSGTLESVTLVGEHLVCVELRDASSRVSLLALDGTPLGEVALPDLGTVTGVGAEAHGQEVFLGFSSFALPPCVLRVALPSPRASPHVWETQVWERVDPRAAGEAKALVPEDYELRFEHCTSRDGTRLSLFLVQRRGRARDGRGPALLTGYGGFNLGFTPEFSAHVLPFLDRGGLYAVAHLRGGNEYGEAWHRDGMLERKQNVFDDFVAVAEHLCATGQVAPERLAIRGGSNGGLLVGAALTQRPELFRAVICQVPLLDMLRYHRFRLARLWISEYGCADEARDFEWLHAYSPYHRVRDGVAYPAVLLTTGEEDSRVDPLHARKMAARLQAATSSARPVLLRVEARAGHGQGKPTDKQLDELVDLWAFLYEELGIAPRDGC